MLIHVVRCSFRSAAVSFSIFGRNRCRAMEGLIPAGTSLRCDRKSLMAVHQTQSVNRESPVPDFPRDPDDTTPSGRSRRTVRDKASRNQALGVSCTLGGGCQPPAAVSMLAAVDGEPGPVEERSGRCVPGKPVVPTCHAGYARAGSKRIASQSSVGRDHIFMRDAWQAARAHPPAVKTLGIRIRASSPRTSCPLGLIRTMDWLGSLMGSGCSACPRETRDRRPNRPPIPCASPLPCREVEMNSDPCRPATWLGRPSRRRCVSQALPENPFLQQHPTVRAGGCEAVRVTPRARTATISASQIGIAGIQANPFPIPISNEEDAPCRSTCLRHQQAPLPVYGSLSSLGRRHSAAFPLRGVASSDSRTHAGMPPVRAGAAETTGARSSVQTIRARERHRQSFQPSRRQQARSLRKGHRRQVVVR